MTWKILVADDESIERAILKQILEENLTNVSVRTAADGISAVETATLWGANLALLDIEMPGMTGIRAAAEIRKTLPKCQIIFLTAYGRFDYAQEALRLQVYDYLLKPAEDQDVLDAVRRALQKISPIEQVSTRAPMLSGAAVSANAGQAANALLAQDAPAPDKNKQLFLQVEEYITAHYTQDISLEEVAELLDFSPFYLSKLFKSTVGTSFIDYLTELRLNAAKDLLLHSQSSAKEIGEAVGYPNSNYFNKLFKKKTGFTPIEYRNQPR